MHSNSLHEFCIGSPRGPGRQIFGVGCTHGVWLGSVDTWGWLPIKSWHCDLVSSGRMPHSAAASATLKIRVPNRGAKMTPQIGDFSGTHGLSPRLHRSRSQPEAYLFENMPVELRKMALVSSLRESLHCTLASATAGSQQTLAGEALRISPALLLNYGLNLKFLLLTSMHSDHKTSFVNFKSEPQIHPVIPVQADLQTGNAPPREEHIDNSLNLWYPVDTQPVLQSGLGCNHGCLVVR